MFQNEISVADIVIWSSLYCILSQPNLVSEHLSHNHIVSWFQNIRKHELVEVSIPLIGILLDLPSYFKIQQF